MEIRLWLPLAPPDLGAAFILVHEALDGWSACSGAWEPLGGVFRERTKRGPVLNYRSASPARTNRDRAAVGSGSPAERLRRLVPLRVHDALQLQAACGFRAGLAEGRLRLEVPPDLVEWEGHVHRREQTGDADIWIWLGDESTPEAREGQADALVDLARHLARALALSAMTVSCRGAVHRWTHAEDLATFIAAVWVTAAAG
jgi:hypothetical protein